ncbi:hypothetical protein [Pedobacter cryoconitis]|uniref:Outer membrane protein beta-barrel domain-containing protein n=1 Tax=Pedobacter cryoconitis TaxID=188932 RepID=A0A327T2X5_9SPHI|nr:hypothetical protein [Pedobacter cryoconitis]RAJ35508.1 hypothetical protein LY11_00752 [Pedobacter cryoconitis]
MEYPKKELIKEIADLFEDYQETYVPGEWESFSKVKKKKYPFLANWIRIAAVFVLMASVLPFVFKQFFPRQKTGQVAVVKSAVPQGSIVKSVVPQVAVVKPPVPAISGQAIAGSRGGAAGNEGLVIEQVQSAAVPQSAGRIAVNNSHPSGILRSDAVPVITEINTQRAADGVAAGKVQPVQLQQELSLQQKKPVQQYAQKETKPFIAAGAKDTANHIPHEKLTTAEFLLAESRNSGKTLKKKEEKGSDWDFGLQVMPTATSDKMNVGGGLTTAYRLSDKFSLSSGISYLQMQAAGAVPGQGNSGVGVSSFSNKKLVSVDANLKAIDIPIALVYKLNKSFYTSAGVSFFSVLSEKRNNTFEQTSQVDLNGYDFQTGGPSTFKAVAVEHVEEPTVEKHLKGNSYIGYFNFSVGRQQHIFNKYKVRIEPFIKIPVGKLSSEDLNLTNSGIKFQLSF